MSIEELHKDYIDKKQINLKDTVSKTRYFTEFLVLDEAEREKIFQEIDLVEKRVDCSTSDKIKVVFNALVKIFLFFYFGKEGIRDLSNIKQALDYHDTKKIFKQINSKSKLQKNTFSTNKRQTRRI